ncbi:hypothetical protein ACH5RR_019868 [Cinchona calisaya]|uniref:RING-type domain-containing protein n=1 Tax=Cinchona calisaya TaxID=153742 RepID=A0ABD2ZRH6_9GENT
MVFFYRLLRVVYKQNSEDSHALEEYDVRPSPSLVSLPDVDLQRQRGEELSVDAYSCPWERRTSTHNNNNNYEEEEDDDDDRSCAVCLENYYMEARSDDEKVMIRRLHNCRHVFHKECLDGWVQRGHVTCPVCRAKLLADQSPQGEEEEWPKPGDDPWRLERMMYLFGEDVLF